MTILTLQKRLRQIATVRHGELVTRNGKTFPSTRDTWRITTGDVVVAQECADLFGGEVNEWDSKSAEKYVVDTTTDRLPIAVVPGHALSQHYELWSGGGCRRRCDGEEELISGGPCLCDPDNRECKPHTRLSFVLRGLNQLGLVRLNTTGYYAAVELAGAVEFLELAAAKGEVLPGWLRIEERRQVRDGQTKVFKVPVIDVQYGLDRMLGSSTSAREIEAPAYKALPPGDGVSAREALDATARQAAPAATSSRSAAPIGPAGDFMGDGPVPVPDDNPAAAARRPRGAGASVEEQKTRDLHAELLAAAPAGGKPTQAQIKKLNVLVGKLRDAGQITTDHLWAALAKERSMPVDQMVELLAGRDTDGTLHWSPLRDSLSKVEASGLIDRLEKVPA